MTSSTCKALTIIKIQLIQGTQRQWCIRSMTELTWYNKESNWTTRGPGDLVPRAGEKGNCPFQIHTSLLGLLPGRAAPYPFMLQGKMQMSPRPGRHCSHLKSLLFVQQCNAVNTMPSFQNKFNTKIINAK